MNNNQPINYYLTTVIYLNSSNQDHFLGGIKTRGCSDGIQINPAGYLVTGFIFPISDGMSKSFVKISIHKFDT